MSPTPAALPAELAHGPVVVEAWASWCSSCRALAPRVEQVGTASGVPVVELQVDADPDSLVETLGVRSVPTLIGLRDGTEVGRLVGLQPADAIQALFSTTRTGTGRVTNRTPTSLVVSRGAAGAAVAVAGLVLDAVVLVAIGAALIAWALAGLARRST